MGFFKKEKNPEFEAYLKFPDACKLVQEGGAFVGVCKYVDINAGISFIECPNFDKPVVARSPHSNRILPGYSCIFTVLSENWKGKSDQNNQQSLAEGSENMFLRLKPNFLSSVEEYFYSDLVAKIKNSEESQNDANEGASTALQDIWSVKVIHIKYNPIKTKDLVVKLFRDPANGVMARPLLQNGLPIFLVQSDQPIDMSSENQTYYSKFFKWEPDKAYPTLTLLAKIANESELLESALLKKEFGIFITELTEEKQASITEESPELSRLMREEPLSSEGLADHRGRSIVHMKLGYFQNKSITFCSETSEKGTKLTVYVPDTGSFIKYRSELDYQTLNMFMGLNLPSNKFDMIPKAFLKRLWLGFIEDRQALAITISFGSDDGSGECPQTYPEIKLERVLMRTKEIITSRDATAALERIDPSDTQQRKSSKQP